MEAISGFVENIIYKSEETGYTVCKLRMENKTVSAVGILPLLKEAQNVELRGEWVNHKQFGRQFKVQEFKEIIPSTKKGIEAYLGSGLIYGIGPATAKKIVSVFGDETMDIMDNHIERLMEIEGIGEKKFKTIYESYIKQQGLKEVMIFFGDKGISSTQSLKIYKKFGVNAVQKVKQNPYILCDEIPGIGFNTADKIAMNSGVSETDDFRIQSAVKFILGNSSAYGNTFMPREDAEAECLRLLHLKDKELVARNIYDMSARGRIILEKNGSVEETYLLPYYYCELGITKKIIMLGMQEIAAINTDIENEIDIFERQHKINFAPSQREAIRGAFYNGMEIITGGPGTGKTTIINAIISIYENNGRKVLLAAPTGRAAKRMTESTGREAKTIHRLLEMGITDDDSKSVFGKDESSPLECDVVVIDEASMIDVVLMQNLLKAIKLGTRLIIVGDVDQLPSVGPGNVLKDFIESGYIKTIRLKEIFRQGKESLIVVNAHRINEGKMPLLNQKDKDFFFMKMDNPLQVMETVKDLVNRRLPKFNKSWNKITDIQVLSPMKKGQLGVNNLNAELQEMFNPASKDKKEKKSGEITFREGDKVMQTKNNYEMTWVRVGGYGEDEGRGIYNGDLGFIEKIDNKNSTMTVIFDEERKVNYDFTFIEELDLAYACTIHKSQGSEFKAVVIPVFPGAPFLMNRNLLYTGITRAKELVVVIGSQRALMNMINNVDSTKRHTGLKRRIQAITDMQKNNLQSAYEISDEEKEANEIMNEVYEDE